MSVSLPVTDGLNGMTNPFLNLPQGDKIQAYYIWVDGSGENIRCVDQLPSQLIHESIN